MIYVISKPIAKAIFAAIIMALLHIPVATAADIRPVSEHSIINFKDDRDYATLKFGDPWDMNRRNDISPLVKNFSSYSVKSGRFDGTTKNSDAYFWMLWGGYPGATPIGRDGIRYPINADYFKRFTIRMYVSASNNNDAQIYWFYSQDLRQKKVHPFKVYKGWHTYIIDMPKSFTGKPIGLRLDPINRSKCRVIIDWIRLTNVSSRKKVTVQWYANTKGDTNIYADHTSSFEGFKVGSKVSKRGYNTYTANLSGLKPGEYKMYVEKSGYKTPYLTTVVVNQTPYIRITNPKEAGGRDWASTAIRNPWDMRNSSDVRGTKNITSKRFSKGVFSGVNSGPVKNDPHFYLNVPKGINANRFRYLTFKMWYSGPFDLVRGTMTRVGWRVNGASWSMSDDFVVYPQIRSYTVDLKKTKLNVGRVGWGGKVVQFRFDPHEDPYSRRFYIDDIRIREIDRVTKHFYIKWLQHDSNDVYQTVTLYRDRDKTWGNGNEVRISKTRKYKKGSHSFRWTPSKKIKGYYWIHAKITDGKDEAVHTSTGMIRVH